METVNLIFGIFIGFYLGIAFVYIFGERNKIQRDVIKFAEWLRVDWQPQAPNKNTWYNNKTKKVIKTIDLYQIFKKQANNKYDS
jgi:hypothetical protein